ncbi:diguanylate cyclase [Vibrio viridaestus]|uniref:Sensor domain-containing diguanylate cyclase n=1 Tax=Vibrio viridaestus TaxID=2487322 RepID=A0A3N9TM91_9VIBR|nr:diguanylate cyclase [Vibrio viridaestus]RQW65124.1 sensor domain-containing diguanylate cyclase [Vibrio viridaestus]
MFLKRLFKPKSLWVIALSLIYWLGAFLLIETAANIVADTEVKSEKEEIRYQVALVRARLEAAIYRDSYLVESLATLVTIDTAFATENWDSIASSLLARASYVRNVGLAPNDVIEKIYPLKGNEKALGLNFKTLPEQYKSVLQAKKLQSIYIVGPVDLVQGGKALIARYPIFTDYPHNNQYWGLVSVVLDYDRLLLYSGVSSIEHANLAIRSYSINDDNNNSVIWGDTQTIENADLSFPIHIPNRLWNIYVQYKDTLTHSSHYNQLKLVVRVFGFTSFIAVYLLILLFVRRYADIHKASYQDELTRLPNRRFMLDTLERLADQNDASPSKFAVLSVDLNDFKLINDTYGHEAGDEVLRYVSKKLTEVLRASDVVSRFGGDEFIVLLHRVSKEEEIQVVIDKLKYAMSDSELVWNGFTLAISMSIGYSIYNGNTSVKELLAKADKKMYADKADMKGR